jgi:hypothetical protein
MNHSKKSARNRKRAYNTSFKICFDASLPMIFAYSHPDFADIQMRIDPTKILFKATQELFLGLGNSCHSVGILPDYFLKTTVEKCHSEGISY